MLIKSEPQIQSPFTLEIKYQKIIDEKDKIIKEKDAEIMKLRDFILTITS